MQRKGVSARQQLSVQQQNGCWTLVQHQEAEIQPRSDEKRILSNVAVLEGAPPLSEHWQLFNNNEVLFNEARTAQAATVVFSLQQNAQIEPLARSIHTLRRQRGSAMKILVRKIPPACAPPMNVYYWPAVQIWLSVECATLPLSDDDRKRARASLVAMCRKISLPCCQ